MLCRRVVGNAVSQLPLAFRAYSSAAPGDFAHPPRQVKLSPSERRALYARFIRVDHAGEAGAQHIYAGQLAILGSSPTAPMLRHMREQEIQHLRVFERLIPQHGVRPTALLPLWSVVGFALGASTALMGKEAAMACTVAVEETITLHYNEQIRSLLADDPEENKELLRLITKCRDEEMEHHDIGLENDAQKAPMYEALKGLIQFGCKGAIWVSEKI